MYKYPKLIKHFVGELKSVCSVLSQYKGLLFHTHNQIATLKLPEYIK